MSAETIQVDGTYWNGRGQHQDKHEQIWRDYVPEFGNCSSGDAEAVRCIACIAHDFYNNGWCNWDVMDYERAIVRARLETLKHVDASPINWGEDFEEDDGFYHPAADSSETAAALERAMDAIVVDAHARLYASP